MNRPTRIFGTVIGGGLVLATLMPLSPASAACAPDLVTEGGTCATRIPDPPMTAEDRRAEAEDAARLDAIDAQLRQQAAGGSGQRRAGAVADDRSYTPKYTLPEIENMRIFREGQGNGKKHYTCGPSATRNVVAALYKRATGKYKDLGEHQFEIWEGTTTAGTARANIASALNRHVKAFGRWRTYRPEDATRYLSQTVSNALAGRAMITNVDTEFLPRFRGHKLDHFDFVFGYDLTTTRARIRLGEEWDPAYIYGNTPSYGNPYGKVWQPLAASFKAVDHTSIHGVIA